MSVAACGSETENDKINTDNTVSISEEVTDSVGDTSVSVEEREDEFSVSEDLVSVTLGKYEQNNITQNGTEPIEWIILETQDDKALVISKYILDCQPFNEGFAECTWETSSIRKWLNSDFYDSAFSQGEKERIVKSFVPDCDETDSDVDSETTEENTEPAETETKEPEAEEPTTITGTEDYVFLLSDFELAKYLSDDPEIDGDESYATATAYAVSKGVWTLTKELYSTRNYAEAGVPENCIGAGWWWLRTSGDKETKALDVDTDGLIRKNGHDVGECHDGVRPAMWITINK